MNRLKRMREDVGLSVIELADAIGKSRGAVHNIEAGRYALTAEDTIAAWADALGVHPDEVYHAIGRVPHDLIHSLEDADLETWAKVREILAQRSGET